MSALIIYAKLIMQIKVENENSNFWQILFYFLFSIAFLIVFVFEAVNTCFLLISRKFTAFLQLPKKIEKSKMMACCEMTVIIATVLKI